MVGVLGALSAFGAVGVVGATKVARVVLRRGGRGAACAGGEDDACAAKDVERATPIPARWQMS